MNDTVITNDNAARERAKRLKLLRAMLSLTVEQFVASSQQFERKLHLAVATVKFWETARGNGLTNKGADKVVSVCHKLGLYCTREWLLHGMGIEPYQMSADQTTEALPEKHHIETESKLFLASNPHATIMKVADDALLPRLQPEDYVGGIKRVGSVIDKCNGLACIIQVEAGPVIARLVHVSDKAGYYNLSSLNPDTKAALPTLFEQRLEWVAPIIWQRRKDYEF